METKKSLARAKARYKHLNENRPKGTFSRVQIPNKNGVDGISFWPQVLGAKGEPRQVIYTWYNGNHPSTDLSTTLRYAFNKDFKRYAPHANFPQGRFFDLRTDPMEMAGDRKVKVAWVHYHSSGLDLSQLDSEQKAAYEQLGRVLETHQHVPVTKLRIAGNRSIVNSGKSMQLKCQVLPANATRKNIIWESSDSSVATIDKFGVLTGHAQGTATLSVYSWDDAYPVAANVPQTFSREGIQDSIKITVKP